MKLETTTTKVVNVCSGKFDIYIGRGTKWGNPFRIGRDGSREEVIRKYEKWLLEDTDLVDSLHELKGKTLGCHCKPLPCHGEVLVKLIKRHCK